MKESTVSLNTVMISVLKSVLVSIVFAAILILVFTSVAFSADDPDSLVEPLSLIALYASALVGGFTCIKFCDCGILSGVFSGASLAAIIFILSFIPVSSTSDRSVGVTALLYAAIILAGVVGSFLGRKKSKKKPNMRKMMRR